MPASTEKSRASDELKTLLHEAEQALSDTPDAAGDRFEELRNRLRMALDSGPYSFDRLRTETTRRAKQADQLVRDNPYYAVGVAAGIGALIGILVARSRNHLH